MGFRAWAVRASCRAHRSSFPAVHRAGGPIRRRPTRGNDHGPRPWCAAVTRCGTTGWCGGRRGRGTTPSRPPARRRWRRALYHQACIRQSSPTRHREIPCAGPELGGDASDGLDLRQVSVQSLPGGHSGRFRGRQKFSADPVGGIRVIAAVIASACSSNCGRKELRSSSARPSRNDR